MRGGARPDRHHREPGAASRRPRSRSSRPAQRMAQMRLDDTRVVAPFSGFVAEKRLEVGASVSSQAAATSNASIAILTLQDIDPVKVQVEVPERDVARVRPGQRRPGDQRRLSGSPVLRPGRAGRARARPAHPHDGRRGGHPEPREPPEAGHVRARRPRRGGPAGRAAAPARGAHRAPRASRPSWSCATARSRRRSWSSGPTDGPQVQVVKGLAPDAQVISRARSWSGTAWPSRPCRPRATEARGPDHVADPPRRPERDRRPDGVPRHRRPRRHVAQPAVDGPVPEHQPAGRHDRHHLHRRQRPGHREDGHLPHREGGQRGARRPPRRVAEPARGSRRSRSGSTTTRT